MMDIIKNIPLKKLIMLGIGTVFILFLIFKVTIDAHAFVQTTKEARVIYLWYAFLIILSSFIFNPLRWYFILKAYNYNIGFKKVFYALTAAGAFILVPGRLGDFVRSYFTKDQIPPAESIGSVIVEKIIDVNVLLLISAAGLMLFNQKLYSLIALAIVIFLLVGVFIVKKIGRKLGLYKIQVIKKIGDSIRIPEEFTYLLAAIFISAINWLASITAIYFLFTTFNVSLPFIVVVAYIPITIFAGLIPISLAGIGVRDSAIIALFASYATSAQSLAVGLTYSFLAYILFMLVGIPLAVRHFSRQ